jgi:hypothetical protein
MSMRTNISIESLGFDAQEPQSIAGSRPLDPSFGVHEQRRTATSGNRPVPPLLHGRIGDGLKTKALLPLDPHDSIWELETVETARVAS